MAGIETIGQVPWSREDLAGKLAEFSSLYDKRPVEDNAGGMLSSHMFFMWFALQALKPKAVIESGVWLGQGTWFIENACPDAQLFCIDPTTDGIRYRSERAKYLDRDFATVDWGCLKRDETVLFFDDHQNAYERVKAAKWFGFTHLLFEDNYPPSQGDCYSLKKAFSHSGFMPSSERSRSVTSRLARKVRSAFDARNSDYGVIPPNDVDARYLRGNLETYYEFPPIFKVVRTRWGDPWTDDNYPTPEPLLRSVDEVHLQRYMDEAVHYTWMCYVRLKQPGA